LAGDIPKILLAALPRWVLRGASCSTQIQKELRSLVDLQSPNQSNEGFFVQTQVLGRRDTIAASLGKDL
jgi:hypothetical protein